MLITGAASGIGRAIAGRAAFEGATIAALDIDENALGSLIESLPGRGHTVRAVDICDSSGVRSAIDSAARDLGGLDAVVASAGVTVEAATESLDVDRWERVLRINLTGVFVTVKFALPHLRRAGGGAIVTIGSTASVVAAGRSPVYAASKGGVLQLTRYVAAENAHLNIRANCLCPGAVTTGLLTNSRRLLGVEEGRPTSPAAEVAGSASTPEQVACVATFLCSDESSLMTGAAVMVDQGATAS